MSNLILKWRYIKSGMPKHARHHVKYIATREGEEKTDESWKLKPVTRAQERLIQNLVKDFSYIQRTAEYESCCKEKRQERNAVGMPLIWNMGALRLFRYLGKIIYDSAKSDNNGKIGVIDRKQRQRINEKKQA